MDIFNVTLIVSLVLSVVLTNVNMRWYKIEFNFLRSLLGQIADLRQKLDELQWRKFDSHPYRKGHADGDAMFVEGDYESASTAGAKDWHPYL